MDISIGNRSEATGRFNFVRGEDGDVQFDDTEAHAVITSVIEEKETWWADPTHGTNLRRLRSLTSRTPSQAEAEALDGLQPLIDDGAIEAVQADATATVGQANRLDLTVSWSTPGARDQRQVVEV